MNINSSGEELVVKTRKPYTITKQRERWSEEEHNRFLEALKLYGRAWQRIEEHIGTKTAVQIRSHAQKFFTKLEKEALAKGIPLGQAPDIDIPPPRPKRKPTSPYPRKRGASCVNFVTDAPDEKTSVAVNPQATSKRDSGLEPNTSLEVIATTKLQHETNQCSDAGNCSVLLNLFQDAPSASISSGNKCPTKPVSFREFVPMVKEPKEMHCIDRSSLSIEVNMKSSMNGSTKSDQALERTNGFSTDMYALQPNSTFGETSGAQKQAMKSLDCDIQQGSQRRNYHASMDMPTACTDKSSPKVTVKNGEFPSNASPFMNHAIPAAPGFPTSSVVSTFSQPFPSFPPFAELRNTQGFHRSFLNISSTFSSLIISTLQQNPAVHAAACMAASLWPPAEMDSSVDSSIDSSSMAAIAAATVAAASAWWATHGLLPFFPPIHAAGFTYPPPPNIAVPIVNTCMAPQDRMEEKHGASYRNPSRNDQQAFCPERLEGLKSQSSPSKLVLSSSSDYEKIEKDASNVNNSKPLSGTASHPTSEKTKISKKPERSSCGSNTPSSSEVETDAALKKNGEATDENKQAQFHNLPSGEVNNRRARISGSMNESWKEVSQEGRLAFQALFTRNILPQTFSHQLAEVEMVFPKDTPTEKYENGLLSKEVVPEKLKVCRTGFKPYKRCSAEVGDNRSSALGETSNKRICLKGEASS